MRAFFSLYKEAQVQQLEEYGIPSYDSPNRREDFNVHFRFSNSSMLDTLRTSTDKNDGTVALVKSGIEKMKTTPAGEYLTSALNDFDPEQHESLAAVSDGANKLLMLVSLVERILEKGHTGRI